MLFRALVIVALASVTTACFDLGLKPELMASGLRDISTFSAFPCGDVDGDGVGDIVLNAQDTRDPKAVEQPGAWVLSGKNLAPIYSITPQGDGERLIYAMDAKTVADSMQVGPGDVVAFTADMSKRDIFFEPAFFLVDPHQVVRKPEPRTTPAASATTNSGDAQAVPDHDSNVPNIGTWTGWIHSGLISSHEPGWQQTEAESDSEKDPFHSASIRVTQAHPNLQHVGACGDVDGDGVVDWSGITEKPRSVVLVSGADLSVLRTIPMESRDLATAATGTFALGDVDGDGVSDWLVGIHVSQSDDHDAPRTCRLGLIAIVSGADFHVIKSLERESFLVGPGRNCPTVVLPEPVQP